MTDLHTKGGAGEVGRQEYGARGVYRDPQRTDPVTTGLESPTDALRLTIPWVAASGRGLAQEALARACAHVDYDPWDWTNHRSVLRSRLALIVGESSVSTLGDDELWQAAKHEILKEQSRV